MSAFNAQLHLVINDLAEVARSYEEFAAEIHEAFKTNGAYEQLWKTAILAVRKPSENPAGPGCVGPVTIPEQFSVCGPTTPEPAGFSLALELV